MTNFTFLKTDDWQPIYHAAAKAEQYTRADPRAVEVIVDWLCTGEMPAVRRPDAVYWVLWRSL